MIPNDFLLSNDSSTKKHKSFSPRALVKSDNLDSELVDANISSILPEFFPTDLKTGPENSINWLKQKLLKTMISYNFKLNAYEQNIQKLTKTHANESLKFQTNLDELNKKIKVLESEKLVNSKILLENEALRNENSELKSTNLDLQSANTDLKSSTSSLITKVDLLLNENSFLKKNFEDFKNENKVLENNILKGFDEKFDKFYKSVNAAVDKSRGEDAKNAQNAENVQNAQNQENLKNLKNQFETSFQKLEENFGQKLDEICEINANNQSGCNASNNDDLVKELQDLKKVISQEIA